MKKRILTLLFCSQLNLLAHATDSSTIAHSATVTVTSPAHRVALLELYTSEGCSSCPPADRFLNNLKQEGVSDKQIIPLAFHVTYWDYIGWKDRFAKPQYDARQRALARKNKQKTVYTPQFVLAGGDFRRYAHFSEEVSKLVASKAQVSLSLSIDEPLIDGAATDELHIRLRSDISAAKVKDVALYIAVVENNLNSDVNDGENEGVKMQHNYVVRQLSAPYLQTQSAGSLEQAHIIPLDPQWKKQDLSIVAFAENPDTGEILQAVKYRY